jgi:CheY-like chemotaxis protein
MAEGGIVAISGENTALESASHLHLSPGDYVRLTVQDQGGGIHEAHLQRIFDPYFTTKRKGSGLGLTIVYSIIEKHGGRITVDSEPGMGTTFRIYLPASPGGTLDPAGPEEALTRGSGRILVMDDERFIRTLAAEMLGKIGYEAELARDGDEAVQLYGHEIASGRHFDAVILDLTIPGGMGGRETMTRLSEIDKGVRAIVSSGYSNDPVMASFRDYGFKAAVKKPYLIKDLSDALTAALSG